MVISNVFGKKMVTPFYIGNEPYVLDKVFLKMSKKKRKGETNVFLRSNSYHTNP